jgi:hypothetical protein
VLVLASGSGAGVIGRHIERHCGLVKGGRECRCWLLVLGYKCISTIKAEKLPSNDAAERKTLDVGMDSEQTG